MNKTVSEVISDIITYHGAIAAKTGHEELEYIAPKDLSEKLRISEYGRIGFDYNSFDEGVIPAYYDSDLFKSIGKLLDSKGKIASAIAEAAAPNVEKISKIISSSIGFSNATFRMGQAENACIPYALIVFKYWALSDDKKEGLCPVLINELTLSTSSLDEDLSCHIINNLKGPGDNPSISDIPNVDKQVIEKLIRCAYSASTIAVKEKLSDFIKSLEKRLNRDINRVYEYYEALKEESKKLIAKAENNSRKEDIVKLSGRLEAIEAEQKWKVHDLISKYALKIEIEPLFMIRIQTRSIRFWIDIKRRSQSRPFALTYNSLLKRLDPLPCEACFAPKGEYYICDDYLHITCADCFKNCPNCGKRYCSRCFKEGCPKCRTK